MNGIVRSCLLRCCLQHHPLVKLRAESICKIDSKIKSPVEVLSREVNIRVIRRTPGGPEKGSPFLFSDIRNMSCIRASRLVYCWHVWVAYLLTPTIYQGTPKLPMGVGPPPGDYATVKTQRNRIKKGWSF